MDEWRGPPALPASGLMPRCAERAARLYGGSSPYPGPGIPMFQVPGCWPGGGSRAWLRTSAPADVIVAASIGFRPAGRGAMDWRLGPTYRMEASLAQAVDSPRVCLAGTRWGYWRYAAGDVRRLWPGRIVRQPPGAVPRAGRRREQRRPAIHRLIAEGTLPDGYASDNGTGLILAETDRAGCVTEVDGARTWQITGRDNGGRRRDSPPARLLPS